MAESIKDKFPGIGNKTVGSDGTSDEWNGIVDELVEINASAKVDLGKDTSNTSAVGTSITIGEGANDNPVSGGSGNIGQGGITAIGKGAQGSDWRATALGEFATAQSVSSTAIGYGAAVPINAQHGTALGRGAHVPEGDGQGMTAIGSTTNEDLYLANGWGHEWDTPVSGVTSGVKNPPSNHTIRIHGQDAKDYRATPSDFNVEGGHLALVGGRGTGTAGGGHVDIETAQLAPSTSLPNNKRPTQVAARFDAINDQDTRFLLLDTTDGTLKRVSFGADDSAGTGFKVLKVAN